MGEKYLRKAGVGEGFRQSGKILFETGNSLAGTVEEPQRTVHQSGPRKDKSSGNIEKGLCIKPDILYITIIWSPFSVRDGDGLK